jgi:predicted acetyltransferase
VTLEIRPIKDEDIEQAEAISGYAFNSNDRQNVAQRAEQHRRFYSADWSLAAFEDGEMTTYMRMLPFVMRINGGGIPFGAVSPVAASPLHRRKGHTGALLSESVRVMRERGQVLSGLYTPHPAFYRRYGWEIAAEQRVYSFRPKDLRLNVQPREGGRFRQLQTEDWAQLDAIYRKYTALANGALHRGAVWWPNAVLGAAVNQPADVALWEDNKGEAQGYIVFNQPQPPGQNAGKVIVRELVSLTSDAYLNLLLYLGRHDIASEIVIVAGVEDALMNLFYDTERLLEVRQNYTVMLRVCDFERAMALRRPVDAADELELTIEIHDPVALWNEGVWRLGQAEGQVTVEQTHATAQLSLTAATLAPVFNGFLKPSRAASVGLVTVHDRDALQAADRLFATHQRPHFLDGF